MNNILLIGDLHAKLNNIEDTNNIFDLVSDSINENTIGVIFTGDLYHTHAVVRQEIISTLQLGFQKIRSALHNKGEPRRADNIFVIAGNHDGASPDSTKLNAIKLTLKDLVNVVDDSTPVVEYFGKIAMITFTSNNDIFVERANSTLQPILITHQTYDGSHYDNGFYAPNGIDQNRINARMIINGHIHTKQKHGKVLNIGTPRAVSSSEIFTPDTEKGIYKFDLESEGFELIPTTALTKVYHSLDFNSDSDMSKLISILSNKKLKDELKIVLAQDTCSPLIIEQVKNLIKNSENVKLIEILAFKNKESVNIESNNQALEDHLKDFVYNIHEAQNEQKESIWKIMQDILQNYSRK